MTTADGFLREIWTAAGGDAGRLDAVRWTGEGDLPSFFPVTDMAAGAVASAGLAAAELLDTLHGTNPAVRVDRRLASLWFGFSIRPEGWSLPPAWDSIAGDYEAADGWIRLHTNAPHHRRAALRVLGTQAERADVARAVRSRSKIELESAIVDAGGCAAAMHTIDEWQAHAQGRAVSCEPLVLRKDASSAEIRTSTAAHERPLRGIRVLDLTRVLAGPIATRFLAGLGADVLRLDPSDWNEPAVEPEITLGKRCARLDLRDRSGRETFVQLLAQADVLVHGYRPGALDALGFASEERARIRPGLVDVSLDAYGWSGPWAGRRGFDSLVQMSTGIAAAGMQWRAAEMPVPLPVQALDHTAGYVMAAAALLGLARRARSGIGTHARTSLARIAHMLIHAPPHDPMTAITAADTSDVAPAIEETVWGPARRLRAPVEIEGAALRWDLPAAPLGTAPPQWM